jgi:TetR/AcrR family transcriptional repressor of nem operon
LFEDESIKPLDRIINFYKSKIANMEQKEYKYGCFVGNLTQEMGDVNKSIAKTTNTLHNMVSSKILLCILEAKEKYGYNPVSKPQILANYINNSWQGALVRMKSSENREPLDEFYTILIEVLLK